MPTPPVPAFFLPGNFHLAVIRFRTTTERPRNWLSRREQWRLLLLVFSLGLVVVMMSEVRKPQRWEWFWAITGQSDASDVDAPAPPVPEIDTRVRPSVPDNLPIDVFVSPAPEKPSVDMTGQFFPGVRPEYLQRVEDHKVFRRDDHQAWFHLFQVLADHDPRDLERASTGQVGYVQLYEQPDVYRGRLVTIRGAARRVLQAGAPENDVGVESYYQVVVRLTDGPALPLMVYSLDLPDGFPIGEKIDEAVSITGFFFKNTAYATGGDIHSYPTLLARTVEWDRPTAADQSAGADDMQTTAWLAAAVFVLAAAFAVVVARWAYTSSRRIHGSATRHGASSIGPLVLVAMLIGGQAAADDSSPVDGPRELLAMQGVDESLFREFVDGRPLADDNEQALLKLLYAVRRIDGASVDRWSRHLAELEPLAVEPDTYRGQFVALDGRVTGVVRIELPVKLAERFEMDAYYRCELQVAPGQTAVVLSPRVPKAWRLGEPLDERASTSGLFVKVGAGLRATAPLVFAARRLAWYPDKISETGDSGLSGAHFGMTVLGGVGMDVALWDDVQNRKPIGDRDREAFYQLLGAVERLAADETLQLAQRALALRMPQWRRKEAALSALKTQLKATSDQPPKGDGDQAATERSLQQAERRLGGVRHALARADEGRFSVAPLFNWPEEQYGRLMVLEGVARRAIEVHVGSTVGAAANQDVRDRFGIDHYYEVDIFTDDSQDNPIVFCVRHLPAGFPTGEKIAEPVRLAGFFFKWWAFRSSPTADSAGESGPGGQVPQMAPLLVAREPTWLKASAPASFPAAGVMFGGLFLLALIVVWLCVWASSRSDGRFRRRAIADRFALEEGTSLDDLNLDVSDPKRGSSDTDEVSGSGR